MVDMQKRWLGFALICGAAVGAHAELEILTVQCSDVAPSYIAEGVVEAVRESQIAAQMTGRVSTLSVKAGDTVKAGQELARIDERIADDQVAASQAQFDAARKEFERSRELFQKQYISQAAMDRVEAQFKALRAQANSMATQRQLHIIVAPYAGVIASVPIAVGDMALPGKPLFSMYDPHQFRVVVSVPETVVDKLRSEAPTALEIPAAGQMLKPTAIEILPTRDANTHTAVVRLPLAPDVLDIQSGQFARAYLPTRAVAGSVLLIPQSAVLHRAEFDAVYVIDKNGKPQLRQLHLGRIDGANVEVLAGLDVGERIARDPLAAAQAR